MFVSDTLSLHIPHTRLSTVVSPCLFCLGPSTWNVLSLRFLQKPFLDSFKSNFKTFLPKTLDLPCFPLRAKVREVAVDMMFLLCRTIINEDRDPSGPRSSCCYDMLTMQDNHRREPQPPVVQGAAVTMICLFSYCAG